MLSWSDTGLYGSPNYPNREFGTVVVLVIFIFIIFYVLTRGY